MQLFKILLVKTLYLIIAIVFAINVYADNVISNEYYIPYDGQKIYLKEKKLLSTTTTDVIVLLNSLSIPALSAFDVPGYSLMDALAKRGYDVWGIDFIGEGKSSYPKVMNSYPVAIGIYPLQANEAMKQLSQAVHYIYRLTGKDSLSILGWSWGSVLGAMYAIENPTQVNKLILYGSMYSSALQESIQPIFIKPFTGNNNDFSQRLPAYQNIPWKVIDTHWKMMLNGNDSIVKESAVQAVAKVYAEIDPKPTITNSLRRPMGPMRDLYLIWNGKPMYDVSKLTTPTLVIYGDQDMFADHNLYSKLINVKTKQKIEIKEATHWLIYEKTREQFIMDVANFLDTR